MHKLVLIHSCILLFLLCQPGAIKKKSYIQFYYDSLIFSNENKFYIKWGKSRYLLLVILFSQCLGEKNSSLTLSNDPNAIKLCIYLKIVLIYILLYISFWIKNILNDYDVCEYLYIIHKAIVLFNTKMS